ncbi:MAG: UvrD-helicase domain-containing protein, partial [Eubacteriales bacterium]|nr:UvrD-helicase domain-containing protein [Eubacteriales bacterium]
MPKWTPQQQLAIDARNPRVLVSAAAGSGKTSVLIARVLGMLKEGLSLDRLLILTFTNAAAGEMQSRLLEKLEEEAAQDPKLVRQLALVERADVTTLHAFCSKLVKRYFHAAQTDPNSRVADEQAARALFDRALDEALNALYENPGEDGQNLIDRFKEAEIIQMASQLHNFLLAQADPWSWLEESLRYPDAANLRRHPWAQVMRREARLYLQGAINLVEEAKALCLRPLGPARYLDALQDDGALIMGCLEALTKEDGSPIPSPAFTRLATRRKGEEDPSLAKRAKDLRDAAKKAVTEALALLPGSPEKVAEWAEEIALTLPSSRALARLVRETHERYQELKADSTLWDYNDLEHFALKALSRADVSAEAAGSYDAIFVDEYQDISHIQEAIIRRLHDNRNSLFMVGDVKQSIYRFRLADPSLFLKHYRQFSREPEGMERVIPLKENFRSQPNILHAVNLVFENTMREGVTEINYDEEARLTAGRETPGGEPVELWLIDRRQTDGTGENDQEESVWEDAAEEESVPDVVDSAFDYEARLIAQRILALKRETIPDGNGSSTLIRFKDIAVLLRRGVRRAAALARVLGEAGIPAYSDADSSFYELPEVRDALNLLRVLDNPYDDESLLAALACPAFGFSPGHLAALRQYNLDSRVPLYRNFFALAQENPQVGQAAERLSQWRFLAENLPLERFVRRLLRESGLYTLAGARPEGELRRANLRMLASLAAPAPDPQTLSGFIKRADDAGKAGRQRSASLGEHEDVVRVMTLHASKGLEFPVVFLPDLASGLFRGKGQSPLFLDAQSGMAVTLVKPEERWKKDTFATRAIAAKKNREEMSEESRLLYVGMTRARERLILVASPSNPVSCLSRWGRPQNDYAVGSAASMLDWIGACLHEAIALEYDTPFMGGSSRLMVYHRSIDSLPPAGQAADIPRPEMPGAAPSEKIKSLFDEPPATPQLPLKSSVTALITGRLGMLAEEEEETPGTKRREVVMPLPLAPLPQLQDDKPLSAAQRGIATHRALGALDPAAFTGLEEEALGHRLQDA